MLRATVQRLPEVNQGKQAQEPDFKALGGQDQATLHLRSADQRTSGKAFLTCCWMTPLHLPGHERFMLPRSEKRRVLGI